MAAEVIHFKVGNGDMTLFVFEDGRTLLTDIYVRGGADDPEDKEWANVAGQLRARLKRDAQGRLYVDAFLLTHPDKDHVHGLQKHFHLGPASDWSRSDDKILIGEQWSSPIVFRRADKRMGYTPCADAVAWSREARRRVKRYREYGHSGAGERILILGEDIDGKTDDLRRILIRVDEVFNGINGAAGAFSARLIAPLPADDDGEDVVLSTNDSSVIIALSIHAAGNHAAGRYLIGGDAGVAIWERVWERYRGRPGALAYDVLLAPHHCSWRSLSWDSWSELGEDAEVSEDARSALGQALPGAMVLSSSKKVVDDDDDPPCFRAKREYVSIAREVTGSFLCLADHSGDDPYVIEITAGGPRPKRPKPSPTLGAVGSTPLPHGG